MTYSYYWEDMDIIVYFNLFSPKGNTSRNNVIITKAWTYCRREMIEYKKSPPPKHMYELEEDTIKALRKDIDLGNYNWYVPRDRYELPYVIMEGEDEY